jgi:hypothetical protein
MRFTLRGNSGPGFPGDNTVPCRAVVPRLLHVRYDDLEQIADGGAASNLFG